MMNIVESKFIKSAVKPVDYYATPYVEIAVVGKSNVGKSSLINTLLNRRNIAKVSSTPGKTRLVNFFEVRVKLTQDEDNRQIEGFFSLADLPGYGYAKVSKTEREKWKTMVGNYLEHRKQLKTVIMLVDIRHNADEKDRLMMELLFHYQIPFFIIATKSDKIPKNSIPKHLKMLANEFNLDCDSLMPFSSLKKDNLCDMLSLIEEIVFS